MLRKAVGSAENWFLSGRKVIVSVCQIHWESIPDGVQGSSFERTAMFDSCLRFARPTQLWAGVTQSGSKRNCTIKPTNQSSRCAKLSPPLFLHRRATELNVYCQDVSGQLYATTARSGRSCACGWEGHRNLCPEMKWLSALTC